MHEKYDDNNSPENDPYKFYFKIDVHSDWFKNLFDDLYVIQNIDGFPTVSIPVNSYFSNTANDTNQMLYLGNNYQNQPIWKKQYFVKDQINTEYKNHVFSHSLHFVKQPNYYKGMFDILN